MINPGPCFTGQTGGGHPNCGLFGSIIIDSNDHIHITHRTGWGKLIYLSNITGTFQSVEYDDPTITSTTHGYGLETTLVIDSNGDTIILHGQNRLMTIIY